MKGFSFIVSVRYRSQLETSQNTEEIKGLRMKGELVKLASSVDIVMLPDLAFHYHFSEHFEAVANSKVNLIAELQNQMSTTDNTFQNK